MGSKRLPHNRIVAAVLFLWIFYGCIPDSGTVEPIAPLPPKALFSVSKTMLVTGQSAKFTDGSSDADTHEWAFEGGDPISSTDKNPEVRYMTAGSFSVSLKVVNPDGEDVENKPNYITVIEPGAPPSAAFSTSATSIETGQTITFSDESTNAPSSWAWVFDGGDPGTSTDQNPSITYPTAGLYSVSLTASNTDGDDVETKTDLISVTEPVLAPIADFTASETIIMSGQNIDFTDTSTNMPTSWAWTFVGGSPETSTDQHPTVLYTNFGVYEVSLTATNTAGSDLQTKTGYITVNQQTASYTVTFQGNWNAANHPTDFPTGNDHFSAAVGMVHQQGATLFEEGAIASLGIKDMAELGVDDAISAEVANSINAGDALNYINGGGLPNGSAQISFTINVTEEFSLVTLVSMIAPSPDWFVAVENVDLFNDGSFVSTITLDGIAYDAGTDSGTTFDADDEATDPAGVITLINTAPLGNGTAVTPPVAFFSFVKN